MAMRKKRFAVVSAATVARGRRLALVFSGPTRPGQLQPLCQRDPPQQRQHGGGEDQQKTMTPALGEMQMTNTIHREPHSVGPNRSFDVHSREEMLSVQEDDRIYQEVDRIEGLVSEDAAVPGGEKDQTGPIEWRPRSS